MSAAPQFVSAAARRLSPAARDSLRRARAFFAPAERMTMLEWAPRRRKLHSGHLAGNGFDWDEVPALKGIAAAYNEPGIDEIWGQKSAQFGFTQAIYLNVFGYHVELDPCPMGVLFSKDGAGERFMEEKLEPMIRATPVLAKRIKLEARSSSNTKEKKAYDGGYIQLSGTRVAANVKSSDWKVVIVEEPDDTGRNVQGQGDAIALGRERYKAYPDGKMLVGGTPTIKGLSKVEAGMEATDKRRMFVACPHCEHEQTLRWSQVRWDKKAAVNHPVYGKHQPHTARYACEACGIEGQEEGFWNDEQKRQAIVKASRRPDYGWRATGLPSRFAGFYFNELYSIFPGSRLEILVEKFLAAEAALKKGDDTKMRSFVNNQLGETWELKGNNPEREELIERGEDYEEWTCPAEALIATCFVDVQRGGDVSGAARLHYLVEGWGRGMENWGIARGIVIGNPLERSTWDALDAELAKPIRNLGGGSLPISMMGVDSGDGMTQEAVYGYVRAKKREGRRVMATKGSSQHNRPIFALPKAEDATDNDKAARWGLKLYFIGTDTAKDTIFGRLKLFNRLPDGRCQTGRGEGRLHWPSTFGGDFVDQLTSEIKAPDKTGRVVYQKKVGAANEDLDCKVGNLHCAYKLRLPQMAEAFWTQTEVQVRQRDLLSPAVAPATPFQINQKTTTTTPALAKQVGGARPFGGFS
jgi:phage terminase large subunit GpA-like protein